MKRCPQCLFLYPVSDEHCDFDKTPLEDVDDSALDAANARPTKQRSLPIAAAIGLILGVLAFGIYYAVSHQTRNAAAETAPESATQVSPSPTASPSPSPEVSPSPSPSPSPFPKTAAND